MDNFRFAERAVYAFVSVALVNYLVLAVLNTNRIGVQESFLPLVFLAWFLVLGGVVGLFAGTGLLLAGYQWGFCRPGERAVGAGLLFYVVVVLTLNFTDLWDVLKGGASPRFGIAITVSLICALTLVVRSILREKLTGLSNGRPIVILAVFLAAFAVVPLPFTGSTVDNSLPAQRTGENFILIGLDGADWSWIKPLMKQGDLPNIKELYETGVRGNLRTIKPTFSPLLWTTMATGRKPEEHGVTSFQAISLLGHDGGVTKLQRPAGFWLEGIIRLLANDVTPVNASHRRVPAFWNISDRLNEPIILQNWWLSWPVEPIRGLVVSDRIHFRRMGDVNAVPTEEILTYPPELYEDIRSKMIAPSELTYRQVRSVMNVDRREYRRMMQSEWRHHELRGEFKFIYSMFLSNRNIAYHLLDRKIKDFDTKPAFMILFRFPDLISHTALKYSDMAPTNLGASDEERRRYRRVFREMYRKMDWTVGELIDRYGSGNVILVSDHGFELETKPGRPGEQWYHHKSAPDGMFLAHGPAFASGDIGSLSLYDVFPLLARLKGFPLANSLEGSVPSGVFNERFLEENPRMTVDDYPEFDRPPFVSGDRATNEEITERLEALGYLR